MLVGILGAGQAGSVLAGLIATAGHRVLLANRHDPSSLAELVSRLPGDVEARSARDAVGAADIVVLAVPWARIAELPPAAAFAGGIVIDACNPVDADGPADLRGRASSAVIRGLIGRGRLVKAFNSLDAATFGSDVGHGVDGPAVLPLCGDDSEAKRVVARLIVDCGFAPLDLGSLQFGSELQEPGGELFGRVLSLASATRVMRSAARCRRGGWDTDWP